MRLLIFQLSMCSALGFVVFLPWMDSPPLGSERRWDHTTATITQPSHRFGESCGGLICDLGLPQQMRRHHPRFLVAARQRPIRAASPDPEASQPAMRYIELDSPGFDDMRASGAVYVDKTAAIAELLCHRPPLARRMFFARPRKFGKSLTLDVMAEMLAAGELPKDVDAWSGYTPMDVDSHFNGLAVHDRLKEDPLIATLLRRVHFVIVLSLGDAESGSQLRAAIIKKIGNVARAQFGKEVQAEVMSSPSPGVALETLICAVPPQVPVAVLVDEYDAAIVDDVCKGRWKPAEAGLAALKSLLMTSKSLTSGKRIRHFIVTGVARFARTSLLSGANNFEDQTGHPLISGAAVGFSEEEIRRHFDMDLRDWCQCVVKREDGAGATGETGFRG